MTEDAYDEVDFKMVNGDTYTKRVAAGEGQGLFTDIREDGWIEVDDSTRIRRAEIVSVRLRKNAHEAVPLVSFGS